MSQGDSDWSRKKSPLAHLESDWSRTLICLGYPDSDCWRSRFPTPDQCLSQNQWSGCSSSHSQSGLGLGGLDRGDCRFVCFRLRGNIHSRSYTPSAVLLPRLREEFENILNRAYISSQKLTSTACLVDGKGLLRFRLT